MPACPPVSFRYHTITLSGPEEPPKEPTLWKAEATSKLNQTFSSPHNKSSFFKTLLLVAELPPTFYAMYTISNTILSLCEDPEHLSQEGLQWRTLAFHPILTFCHFLSHTTTLFYFRHKRSIQSPMPTFYSSPKHLISYITSWCSRA